ncbi:amino acid ABC transporter ATP-binding protein, PAAT family (TC 3.A.1.3.-) [Amphritea atlantica]|uniref:Amino acid ABC transporter ATP-binding protein, PAAT family (TC 3.A.1.3.-) n=1 Tax=Amphritea atlantica TaxID=355243 RepID=A0A1H9KT69_9GAMM|nr:amino acid ABC transporter ATP-binding protein [Amphritea atlantica]SER02085.1 amino acid ABC transporter ATP-binding protein, PAAT family (TC 3.A.1.3.-) [Amphritea atlantica]
MSLVSINNVHKYYGSNHVLKGINLEIGAGEVVSIIGRSGSGKSTLLRCINGLEAYSEGGVVVDQMEVVYDDRQIRKLSKSVGMVFQSFNLFPHLTVGQNIMLAPKLVRKLPESEAKVIAQEVLAKVGLAEKIDSYPAELSGGQQQRVAIARSLAMNPKVLLCDEITSALDPELVGEVLKVLEDLAAEGMTLILVTHEMNFARDVGDRVIFMHQGLVWEEGDSKTVLANPQTPELSKFINAVL